MRRVHSILLCIALSQCSSQFGNSNPLKMAAIGAGIGAVGGAALSPNRESVGMNALVFGLTGALTGAAISILSNKSATPSNTTTAFEDEMTQKAQATYEVTPHATQPLPEFLKNRITDIEIDEVEIGNLETEDGFIHEPHKAYRILKAPEITKLPRSNTSEDGRQK